MTAACQEPWPALDAQRAAELRALGWPKKIDHCSFAGKRYAWKAILTKCPRARIEYVSGGRNPAVDLIDDALRPGRPGFFTTGHSEADALARAWIYLKTKR